MIDKLTPLYSISKYRTGHVSSKAAKTKQCWAILTVMRLSNADYLKAMAVTLRPIMVQVS